MNASIRVRIRVRTLSNSLRTFTPHPRSLRLSNLHSIHPPSLSSHSKPAHRASASCGDQEPLHASRRSTRHWMGDINNAWECHEEAVRLSTSLGCWHRCAHFHCIPSAGAWNRTSPPDPLQDMLSAHGSLEDAWCYNTTPAQFIGT